MQPETPSDPRKVAPPPSMLNRIAWSSRWRDRARSMSAAEEVLASAADDPLQHGRALCTLAWQARWRGDLCRADDLATGALRQLKNAALPGSTAAARAVLGVVHYSRGRYDLARRFVGAGFRDLEQRDDREARIDLLVTEATILRNLGHASRAIDCLARASGLASGAERARVVHNIARTHLHDDQLEAAEIYALRSVTLSKRHENRVIYPYALEVLGAAHRRAGRIERARSCFETGRRAARADGDRRAECQILCEAGELALATYAADEAVALLREGKAIAEEIGYDLWKARFCRGLARAYEMSGDLLGALHSMKSLDRLQGRVRA